MFIIELLVARGIDARNPQILERISCNMATLDDAVRTAKSFLANAIFRFPDNPPDPYRIRGCKGDIVLHSWERT